MLDFCNVLSRVQHNDLCLFSEQGIYVGPIAIKGKTLLYVVGGLLLIWLLTGGVAIYRSHTFTGEIRYAQEEPKVIIDIGPSPKISSFDIPFLVHMTSIGKPFSLNVDGFFPEDTPFVEIQLDHAKVSYPDGTSDQFLQHEAISLPISGSESAFHPPSGPQGKGHYSLIYFFPKHLKLDYGKHAYADIELEGALIKKNGERTELKLTGRMQRAPREFSIMPFWLHLMRL